MDIKPFVGDKFKRVAQNLDNFKRFKTFTSTTSTFDV